MKLQPASRKELTRITLGTLVCDAILIAALFVLSLVGVGTFDVFRILLGAVCGTAVAVANFAILCLTVQSAPEIDNKKRMKARFQRSYNLLGLISYLTAGKPEVRAWTIKRGTKAPQAAGKIHSDFERGFIRAEVVAFDDLMACGTMTAAKEKGLVRSEGKEYVMQDGDIVLFRFNV